MSAQGVVNQLRELAAVPSNREYIVKDQGCLPGLVLFLDNDDLEVVYTALETISFLSQADSNKTHMKEELGLMVSLRKIIQESSPRQRTLASTIVATLTGDDDTKKVSQKPESLKYSLKGSSFFSTSVATTHKNRTLTLEIDGLDSVDTRKEAEDAILSVQGTISFTFDMKLARVTIRARKEVEAEAYCRAIHTKYKHLSPKQVVRNQYGDDTLVDLIGIGNGDRSGDAPDYLDDDEEEELLVENPKTALMPTGTAAAGGNGWFGSAMGYVKKSLYW